MAAQTTVTLLDDLDGTKAAETVQFALDGAHFEIDLSNRNAKQLRKVLATFVTAGRQVSTGRAVAAQRRPKSSTPAKIRKWAAANGFEVSAKGRIPAHVQEAYRTR